jgi:hypothetical protein
MSRIVNHEPAKTAVPHRVSRSDRFDDNLKSVT